MRPRRGHGAHARGRDFFRAAGAELSRNCALRHMGRWCSIAAAGGTPPAPPSSRSRPHRSRRRSRRRSCQRGRRPVRDRRRRDDRRARRGRAARRGVLLVRMHALDRDHQPDREDPATDAGPARYECPTSISRPSWPRPSRVPLGDPTYTPPVRRAPAQWTQASTRASPWQRGVTTPQRDGRPTWIAMSTCAMRRPSSADPATDESRS